MNTVAIIQARMGSSRLPEKMLRRIAGRPMLWHVANRTQVASLLDKTIVATTDEDQDDPLALYCEEAGLECARGVEEDVLDRYYQIAKQEGADVVVRVTGDCPLISPAVIDRSLRMFREHKPDYVCNKLKYTFPIGVGAEVVSFDALKTAWEEASNRNDREHVTTYIRRRSQFEVLNIENPLNIFEFKVSKKNKIPKLTVDNEADLEFINEIYDRLYKNGEWTINQLAILELLEREPRLVELTEQATREWFEIDWADENEEGLNSKYTDFLDSTSSTK